MICYCYSSEKLLYLFHNSENCCVAQCRHNTVNWPNLVSLLYTTYRWKTVWLQFSLHKCITIAEFCIICQFQNLEMKQQSYCNCSATVVLSWCCCCCCMFMILTQWLAQTVQLYSSMRNKSSEIACGKRRDDIPVCASSPTSFTHHLCVLLLNFTILHLCCSLGFLHVSLHSSTTRVTDGRGTFHASATC